MLALILISSNLEGARLRLFKIEANLDVYISQHQYCVSDAFRKGGLPLRLFFNITISIVNQLLHDADIML
jgi:hypothetical protein